MQIWHSLTQLDGDLQREGCLLEEPPVRRKCPGGVPLTCLVTGGRFPGKARLWLKSCGRFWMFCGWRLSAICTYCNWTASSFSKGDLRCVPPWLKRWCLYKIYHRNSGWGKLGTQGKEFKEVFTFRVMQVQGRHLRVSASLSLHPVCFASPTLVLRTSYSTHLEFCSSSFSPKHALLSVFSPRQIQ